MGPFIAGRGGIMCPSIAQQREYYVSFYSPAEGTLMGTFIAGRGGTNGSFYSPAEGH